MLRCHREVLSIETEHIAFIKCLYMSVCRIVSIVYKIHLQLLLSSRFLPYFTFLYVLFYYFRVYLCMFPLA